MKRSARAASFTAILLLCMAWGNPEALDSVTSIQPRQQQATVEPLPELQAIWPPPTIEEGTIMEDYGYMIGAESAIEPMYVAPSGYLAEQHDSRFALQAPVPEPETYTMMMAGAGLLGFKFRRKILSS